MSTMKDATFQIHIKASKSATLGSLYGAVLKQADGALAKSFALFQL